MITRLRIDGFKNLVDVEVHFGVFTCIAGANAVGKSNLFDAIHFLSDLADKTLIEAAVSVRSRGQRNANIRDLFTRIGDNYVDSISFEVDMIIPFKGVDDLGQEAEATITSVRYALELKYRESDKQIEVVSESLMPITQQDMKKNIYFEPSALWLKSVLNGRRSSSSPFISTIESKDGEANLIQLHQDGVSGAPLKQKANLLPRTILSITQAAQHPTAVVVKNEMRSWKMLQLETSSLRQSDEMHYAAKAHLTETGLHLPATVYRLQQENPDEDIYQRLSNRLSELVDGGGEISIDKDDKRELLTLLLTNKSGTVIPARSLSDGTLRFLSLAVLELDSQAGSLICLEEPENGIHPKKVSAIITLLKDIACDTKYEVDSTNSLRQVIINTHSPIVVESVASKDLLMVRLKNRRWQEQQIESLHISIDETENWRSKILGNKYENLKKIEILPYLLEEKRADIDKNISESKSAQANKQPKTIRESLNLNLFDQKHDE